LETIASNNQISDFELLFNQQQNLTLIKHHLTTSEDRIKGKLIDLLSVLAEKSESLAPILHHSQIVTRIIALLNPNSDNDSMLCSILSFIVVCLEKLQKDEISEQTYFEIFNNFSSLLQEKSYNSTVILLVLNILRKLQRFLDFGLFERLMINSNAICFLFNQNYFLNSLVIESFMILFASISMKSVNLTQVINSIS